MLDFTNTSIYQAVAVHPSQQAHIWLRYCISIVEKPQPSIISFSHENNDLGQIRQMEFKTIGNITRTKSCKIIITPKGSEFLISWANGTKHWKLKTYTLNFRGSKTGQAQRNYAYPKLKYTKLIIFDNSDNHLDDMQMQGK